MSDRDPGNSRREDMVERRKLPASRSGLYRPAIVAACIGLLLSLTAAYAVGRWEQRVTWIEFEGVAATQLIEMQNGINEYLSRLVTLITHRPCRRRKRCVTSPKGRIGLARFGSVTPAGR